MQEAEGAPTREREAGRGADQESAASSPLNIARAFVTSVPFGSHPRRRGRGGRRVGKADASTCRPTGNSCRYDVAYLSRDVSHPACLRTPGTLLLLTMWGEGGGGGMEIPIRNIKHVTVAASWMNKLSPLCMRIILATGITKRKRTDNIPQIRRRRGSF